VTEKRNYAGFPWFGTWGRDTFISLPGLTIALDDPKTFRAVVDTQIDKMKDGLFPNMGKDTDPAFNSVDAPLWFFWSLQQYANEYQAHEEIWKKYKKPCRTSSKHTATELPLISTCMTTD
jgi:glycogen debranching enzyme